MSEFKIDKDLPIPRRRNGRRYPWREMAVGDSVFIPCENGETPEKTVMRLGNSFVYARPFRFTRRREEGGVRVWRIE